MLGPGFREIENAKNEKQVVNPGRVGSKRPKGKVRIDGNNQLVITTGTGAARRSNNDISDSTRQSAPITQTISVKYIDENECSNINNCNDNNDNNYNHGHKKKSKKNSKSKKETNKGGSSNDNGNDMINMNDKMLYNYKNEQDSSGHWHCSKISKDNKYFNNVNNNYFYNNNSNYYNNDCNSYGTDHESSYSASNNQMYNVINSTNMDTSINRHTTMHSRPMSMPAPMTTAAPMHMPASVNYGYPSYMHMHCHDPNNNFIQNINQNRNVSENEFENHGITVNKDVDSKTRKKFEKQFKKHNIEQFINDCLECGVYGKKFTALMYEKIQQQSSQ